MGLGDTHTHSASAHDPAWQTGPTLAPSLSPPSWATVAPVTSRNLAYSLLAPRPRENDGTFSAFLTVQPTPLPSPKPLHGSLLPLN